MRPRPPAIGGGARQGGAGFTLLEVLVALAIVGIAVAGVLQLTSQSLRLLKLAEEHVAAAGLADRLAREQAAPVEGIDGGAEGSYTWERKVSLVETPEELNRRVGPSPQLFAVSIAVRWNGNRAVELATMRASVPGPLSDVSTGSTGPPGSQVTPQALPGLPGQSGGGRGSGSSVASGSSSGRTPFSGGGVGR